MKMPKELSFSSMIIIYIQITEKTTKNADNNILTFSVRQFGSQL